ncbi:LysR family transcriptional regulator [Burkholderia cepacia]|uniref:LysR family transcriptional regulator n=1 Tax=Burkholderia cepacia TaxID=292 RepID=UPI00249DEA49|nr:LysR family transcriptional regulator [Burkholderia cepacia]WGY71701.1 LysR family transcriptional regulator [Burkholderia cepacia]
MHQVDLRAVDLNLLKLLDALLQERSVTRAGMRLGLTQPAASRALGRLRALLDDRVVVRTPKGLEFTPRAASLALRVSRVLTDAAGIVAPAVFDPATARGQFSIASLDHMALTLIPDVNARLEQRAPGMDLNVPPSRGNNVELVTDGTAGVALGVFDDDTLPAGIYRRKLYDDDLVCIVRNGHPALSARLTAKRFAALSHVLVTIGGRGGELVDAALARQGLHRRIAMRLPHFLVAPMVVAKSDMTLVLPRRLARHVALSMPVTLVKLPVDVPSFALSMIWHERTHDDPAHAWLRQQIADVAREMAS